MFSSLHSEKIIIVGAGLSGLTSAYRLKKLGYTVEIYEARSRPGGRVFTCYFPNGYSELGGLNINDGGEGNTLKALARDLSVPYITYPIKRDFLYYFQDNTLKTTREIFKNCIPPTEQLYNQIKKSHNLESALKKLIPPSELALEQFLTLRSEGYEGCSLNNLSMHYFDSLWGYYCANYLDTNSENKISYNYCTIKNGMCNLIEALCAQLDGDIHFNAPLTTISRDNGKWNLKIGNKIVTTDKVILSIPFSTLRDIHIEGDIIPSDQLQMIKKLQYGSNAKMVIPTKGVSNQCCGANKDCMMLKDTNVLWLYFGGKNGLFDKNTIQEKYTNQISSIKKIYPNLQFDKYIKEIPHSLKSSITVNYPVGISWAKEQYSKGSYSCLAPGQENIYENYSNYCGEKIRTIFRPILHTLFLIGEHTSVHNPATMEGAVESGEQVVRIIRNLNKEK